MPSPSSSTTPRPTVPPLEETVDEFLDALWAAAVEGDNFAPVSFWLGRMKAARGRVCPVCEKPRTPAMCGHAYHQEADRG